MNISISNIAWNREEDDEIASIMRTFGVMGIDVAPSKVFAAPLHATDEEIAAYRSWWEERGFTIVGAQALHFGHPELQLFTSSESRERLFTFTARMIALVGKLGATTLVFGSPKNRLRGELPFDDAAAIAMVFFRKLGEVAQRHGVRVCLEPNATAYGCDFVTTTAEGLDLVERVNHASFRIHLDVGTMVLMRENIRQAIANAAGWMGHFHVSEPHLEQVGNPHTRAYHEEAAAALREHGYDQWVAIEMKNNIQVRNADAVTRALQFVTNVYR